MTVSVNSDTDLSNVGATAKRQSGGFCENGLTKTPVLKLRDLMAQSSVCLS